MHGCSRATKATEEWMDERAVGVPCDHHIHGGSTCRHVERECTCICTEYSVSQTLEPCAGRATRHAMDGMLT